MLGVGSRGSAIASAPAPQHSITHGALVTQNAFGRICQDVLRESLSTLYVLGHLDGLLDAALAIALAAAPVLELAACSSSRTHRQVPLPEAAEVLASFVL